MILAIFSGLNARSRHRDTRNAAAPLPTTLETLHPTTQQVRSATPYGPSTTRPLPVRPLGDEPTLRLPLQEIVQRSVANSQEVRVSGYDPAIAETRIIEAQARFDPTLFANVSWDHTDQQTAGQPDLFGNVIDKKFGQILLVQRGDIYTIEPGVKQLLPSGGEAQISYQVQQLKYEPRTSVLNPYWQNELKFQLTQPLLRDFGFDVNQARITIAQNDQRVSVLDFRKTLEDNISEIEKDYWQLGDAEAEVRIQEELLGRTRQTADILIRQFQEGKQGVSRVQTSQATSSIRAREAVLFRARRVLAISPTTSSPDERSGISRHRPTRLIDRQRPGRVADRIRSERSDRDRDGQSPGAGSAADPH